MSIRNNNSKAIINWIKPLQRSLTLETEYGFINLLGKEKYFNEFLFDNLTKLNELGLTLDEKKSLNYLGEKFFIYSKLDYNQRKRIVIDTRKLLLKLSKSLDLNQNKKSVIYNSKLEKNKLSINSNISEIIGIGKVNKEALNKLGIFNVKDLIYYFPRNYLDYSNKEKIKNLRPENLYTCTGYIKKFFIFKSKKNINLSILNLTIFDETSSIKITKFLIGKRFRSYSYLSIQKEKFKLGTKVAVSGKVKMTEYGRTFIDPQIEVLKNNENIIFSGKILPLYSLAESISNLSYIKIIKKVLTCSDQIQDSLNKKQLKNLSLLSISEALVNIHLPNSQEYLNQSKKRLVFDELLLLQLKFILKRNTRNKSILNQSSFKKKLLLDTFLKNLPFPLTKSQINVLNEIKLDLNGTNPMSRLLQGDVGSGKTIVAITSILQMVEKGYQCALMVPTEVLAQQHYTNLIKHLNSLFVSVELLTGNTPLKKRRQIINDLQNGQVEILVGTHALFEEKVIFNALGLVVIDEQHRFGVSQRNRLLRKGENAHLLSMTATPIPRTLALSIYGDLDISQITELPPGRIPIETTIISENDLSKLYEKIELEINNGKQAYVILPLIEDSEKLNLNSANKIYEHLSSVVFKHFEVGLLHGKLSANDKNNILSLFAANKINILVSTTVIEVGIDVPNASMMIIYNSERFGLSQLHQLRGRVGRGPYKSFCYLVTSENNSLTNKRLKVLQKSNDGFFVAEKDLELRGPGQILGYKQSGLPDFVLDNLPENKILIDKARDEAIRIIDCDPNLENNIYLKKILLNKSENKFIHEFLN